MKIASGLLVAALLVVAALSAAAAPKTFTGIISDDICVRGDHSHMRMGPTDAECAIACVSAHDAAYVLYDGKNYYKLIGRQALEIDFLRRCLQHVEEQRKLQALDTRTSSTRTLKSK